MLGLCKINCMGVVGIWIYMDERVHKTLGGFHESKFIVKNDYIFFGNVKDTKGTSKGAARDPRPTIPPSPRLPSTLSLPPKFCSTAQHSTAQQSTDKSIPSVCCVSLQFMFQWLLALTCRQSILLLLLSLLSIRTYIYTNMHTYIRINIYIHRPCKCVYIFPNWSDIHRFPGSMNLRFMYVFINIWALQLSEWYL